jgi:hypothetical protein
MVGVIGLTTRHSNIDHYLYFFFARHSSPLIHTLILPCGMSLHFHVPTLSSSRPPIAHPTSSSGHANMEFYFDDSFSSTSTRRHPSDFDSRDRHLYTPRHVLSYIDGDAFVHAVSAPIAIPRRMHAHSQSLPPPVFLYRPPTPPCKRISTPAAASGDNPPPLSPSPIFTFRTNGLTHLKSMESLSRDGRHHLAHHPTFEFYNTSLYPIVNDHIVNPPQQMNPSRPAPPPPVQVQQPAPRLTTSSVSSSGSSVMNPEEVFVRQAKIGVFRGWLLGLRSGDLHIPRAN